MKIRCTQIKHARKPYPVSNLKLHFLLSTSSFICVHLFFICGKYRIFVRFRGWPGRVRIPSGGGKSIG
jgi:hypothetical protein